MIPRTLQIKNFLSYGSEIQTISFEPHHLICLSGKNGHGKSALLDAITWALWGVARKISATSRADEGLLRLGQTEMMVVLDFEVNNSMYRIKRQFEIVYGKSYTTLEFGMFNDADNLIPLTDKTIRATQAVIESTIGLDFHTFTNSAFLRQGNANEFSKRSPKDRKEIIATILGLGTYDILKKAATEKAKEALVQKNTFTALQEKITRDLEQSSTIDARYTQLLNELEICTKEYHAITKKHDTCKEQLQQYAQQKEKRTHTETQKKQLATALDNAYAQLHTIRDAWRATHYAYLHAPDTLTVETQLRTLRTQLEEHQTKQQQSITFKEQLLTAREAVHTCTNVLTHAQQHGAQTLTLERERTTMQHAAIIAEQQKCTKEQETLTKTIQELTKTSADTQTQIELLQKQTAVHEQTKKRFEARKEKYQRLSAYGNQLHAQLQEQTQKNALVHDQDSPSCPLCEQNLSASRRRFLHAKLTKELQNMHHRYNRLKRVLPAVKQQLIEQHKALQEGEKQQAACAQAELVYTASVKQKQELEKKHAEQKTYFGLLDTQRVTLEKQAEELQKKIDSFAKSADVRALKLKKELAEKKYIELEETYKKNNYNAAAHQACKQAYDVVEKQWQLLQEKTHNTTLQNERAHTLHATCVQIKTLKHEVAACEKLLQTYTTLAHDEQKIMHEEQTLAQSIQLLSAQKDTLFQEKGTLEAEKKKHLQLHDEHKKQLATIKELDTTVADYQAIAKAASKDGIQALLIEDALPELEQEANDIIAKLTNNQTHISIASLRDLKKGGTKETLDIQISDPSGIRAYELFSGGEAFRIDFALRIALSKLLARRAGTALQTLIIDEGFGSQDEEGLSHIMDAIYKIQDDFAKVIIVSHLNSMKDQFPVHFVVEKGASGSMVTVIEQG